MLKIIEKLRGWLATKSIQACSGPYLPSGLVWMALFLVFTDLMVVLISQPAAYWITSIRAESSFPLIQSMLATGVFLYLFIGLVYLAVLWITLSVFTRSIALVLWTTVSFVHLGHSILWVTGRLIGNDANNAGWAGIAANAIAGLIVGIILVSILLLRPKAEGKATPARSRIWLRRAFLILWGVALIGTVSFKALWPQGGWQLIKSAHTPGHRANTAIVYDSARKRAVLFGGLSDWIGSRFLYTDDTWEWDGKDWQKMNPEHAPPPRAGPVMAYDEKLGVIVLFGGEDISGVYMLNDTWIWDGKDWTQAFSTDAPSPRRGAQMFFDHQTGKIVLAGGFSLTYDDKQLVQYADTWEWDGKNWQYVTSNDQNFIITGPAVAYEPVQQRTVVFDYNELLIWADELWAKSTQELLPAPRFGMAVAANPNSDKILLFGGVDNGVQLNDTWLLDGGTWRELHPELMPSVRDAHAMFYDPTRNSFIVYGGLSTYTLDDMWEFVLPNQ
jgi:hypothetical protein